MIDSMNAAKLKLYRIAARLKAYEIDMGPNGSSYPFKNSAEDLDEVLEYLERIYR